jgi:hypothetical protein
LLKGVFLEILETKYIKDVDFVCGTREGLAGKFDEGIVKNRATHVLEEVGRLEGNVDLIDDLLKDSTIDGLAKGVAVGNTLNFVQALDNYLSWHYNLTLQQCLLQNRYLYAKRCSYTCA